MAAQDAANAVNRAFPDDEIEISSDLLLTLAWLESGWKNVGDKLPVPTGAQPDTRFGPFGFRPGPWAATISDAEYAEILRDFTAFSRIDPYLQCYVAACRVNELQIALLAAAGSAPSARLIRIAELVGAEEGCRFAKLASDDRVDKVMEGRSTLAQATIAAHGDLFSNGGSVRTRAEVEAKIGAQLKEAATTAASKLAMVDQAQNTELGILSRKYEARGPGDVSGGVGDPGGVSYGSYQMTSKKNGGRVKEFISDPEFPWAERFQALTPGKPEFTAAWKKLAADEPVKFFAAQHTFIRRTHFDLLAQNIKLDDAFDVLQRPDALQNVVWSTAVQHGPNTPVVHRAIANVKKDEPAALDHRLGDRLLIQAIYAERGRRDGATGRLFYFPSSSDDVQKSVAKRFVNEERDALAMFDRVA